MSLETINLYLPTVNAVLQFLLVIVGGLYTWETRSLRNQGKVQLDISKRQARLSNLPTLVVGVITADPSVVQNAINTSPFDADVKRVMSQQAMKPGFKYLITIKNRGSNIAWQVEVFVYCSSTRNYVFSSAGAETIQGGGQHPFILSEPFLDRDQIIEKIRAVEVESTEFMHDQIRSSEKSYVGAIYKDVLGNLFFSKREFTIDPSGDIHHSRSSLYYPPV